MLRSLQGHPAPMLQTAELLEHHLGLLDLQLTKAVFRGVAIEQAKYIRQQEHANQVGRLPRIHAGARASSRLDHHSRRVRVTVELCCEAFSDEQCRPMLEIDLQSPSSIRRSSNTGLTHLLTQEVT